jgi:dihydropteroate synthase
MRPSTHLLALRDADRTLIMGVLNVTADSFSDGGRYLDPRDARAHGLELMEAGADIVDIGAESTRPGAVRVPAGVERERVVRAVTDLLPQAHKRGVMLSVDTVRASTAKAALEAGAGIINDVSGGLSDPAMMSLIAESDCLYVIQHWRGWMDGRGTNTGTRADTPAATNTTSDESRQADGQPAAQTAPSHVYEHGVDRDVLTELAARVAAARASGIDDRQIILDPGLGFSKPGPVPNFTLLSHLDRLARLGFPVLVGASRKRFLTTLLSQDGGQAPGQARLDEATAVISALAAQKGAWAVRVHDPARSADAIRIAAAMGARPAVGRK